MLVSLILVKLSSRTLSAHVPNPTNIYIYILQFKFYNLGHVLFKY